MYGKDYYVLKENVIPPSEGGSSTSILSQTQGEEFSYYTQGLGKGGMYYTTHSFGGRNVPYYHAKFLGSSLKND